MVTSIEARALALGLVFSLPAIAQTTVGDLDRYFDAGRRLESGEAVTPRIHYQAGFYAGYLEASRERLQNEGESCLGGCRCHFDSAVEASLLGGVDANRPAAPWLAEVLASAARCP